MAVLPIRCRAASESGEPERLASLRGVSDHAVLGHEPHSQEWLCYRYVAERHPKAARRSGWLRFPVFPIMLSWGMCRTARNGCATDTLTGRHPKVASRSGWLRFPVFPIMLSWGMCRTAKNGCATDTSTGRHSKVASRSGWLRFPVFPIVLSWDIHRTARNGCATEMAVLLNGCATAVAWLAGERLRAPE